MAHPFLLPSQPGNGYSKYCRDAATMADYALSTGGPAYAMQYLPELDRMIALSNWRSEAAASVRSAIVRQYVRSFGRTAEFSVERSHLSMSEDRTAEPVLQ